MLSLYLTGVIVRIVAMIIQRTGTEAAIDLIAATATLAQIFATTTALNVGSIDVGIGCGRKMVATFALVDRLRRSLEAAGGSTHGKDAHTHTNDALNKFGRSTSLSSPKCERMSLHHHHRPTDDDDDDDDDRQSKVWTGEARANK